MEMQVRYCTVFSRELLDYLNVNGIPFSETDESMAQCGNHWLIYTISDRDKIFSQCHRALQRFDHVSVIPSMHYSEKDRSNAEWLSCEAKTAKVELERESETFSVSEIYAQDKAYHRYLSGRPFYVSRPIRHSPAQNFFYSNQLTPSHLFCTERAKQALHVLSASTMFREVLHYKTEKPMEDLFFVDPQVVLPPNAIDLSCVRKEYICLGCGGKTYCPPLQPLQLYREYLPDDSEICKTAEIFSRGGNISFPINLISQGVYQMLKEKKIDRGLQFAPVKLL